MSIDIKVPDPGESISEGVILTWFKQSGEQVAVGDALYELETDKITLTIEAEHAGVLSIARGEGEEVEVGEVVATIDPAGKASGAQPKAEAPAATPSAAPGEAILSPAAKHLAQKHGVDTTGVVGSGKDGRILKEDILRLAESKQAAPAPAPKPAAPKPKPLPALPKIKPTSGPTERQTRKPMTPIRKRIAQRLVEAQSTAAILTTFNEVDLSAIIAIRKKYQDMFVKKYGIKLGFMSFFVKAVVDALQSIPQLNSYIDGEEIVQNHFYDIGIAVGTERGLVVPVVRNAEQLKFAEVEASIAQLGKKARDKKLTLDDLKGGSFTISNGGVYGSLMSTPILNPPQTGILGMHGIKKRPVAVGDKIEIRPMMYLALSYDHRVVDGREAVTFLKRVVECCENPERMLLEV